MKGFKFIKHIKTSDNRLLVNTWYDINWSTNRFVLFVFFTNLKLNIHFKIKPYSGLEAFYALLTDLKFYEVNFIRYCNMTQGIIF